MLIQERKAKDNGIKLFATFRNFEIYSQRRISANLFYETDEVEPVRSQMVMSDRQRVMQIILCLQSNALKFTENGVVEIVVQVIIKNDKQFLQI